MQFFLGGDVVLNPKICTSIEIGDRRNIESLLGPGSEIRVDDTAMFLIAHMPGLEYTLPLNLKAATTRELTGAERVGLEDVFEAIRRAGHELLPREAGPQLRHQFKNQPTGQRIKVASEPMTDPRYDKFNIVFVVEREKDGSLWLKAEENLYSEGGDLWAFRDLTC